MTEARLRPGARPFALRLRLWSETQADIEARLQRVLAERRQRGALAVEDLASPAATGPAEGGTDEQDRNTLAWIAAAEAPQDRRARLDGGRETRRDPLAWLSPRATTRIRLRAKALVQARTAASGVAHLPPEDVARLRPVAGGVALRGPATAHAADELVARLLEEMPWHAPMIEVLWRDLRGAAARGEGLRVRPLLLDGPPGLGKTHLAQRLAALAGVPFVSVDVSSSSEGWLLSGVQRTWRQAAPGRPVASILETGVANPLVFVDEIDKGGPHRVGSGGTSTAAHLALLSLLEPVSARAWECPYFVTSFDLSRVNWLLAANAARALPAPLLSRLRVLAVRAPTRAECLAFARRELARLGLGEDAAEVMERLLHLYPEGDARLSPRRVLRHVEDLAALAGTGEVRH